MKIYNDGFYSTLVSSTTHSNGVDNKTYSMINDFSTEEKNARAIQVSNCLKLIIGQKLVSSIDGKRIQIRK